MERRFEGKVALVTGATTGIGQATAERLATDGAVVAVNHLPGQDPGETMRRIAAFLPDGDGETVPSNVEGVLYPIHALKVTAMGMLAADSLQLEDVAQACEQEGRFEFLVVGLPLRLPGGTGSPWNPIAIF